MILRNSIMALGLVALATGSAQAQSTSPFDVGINLAMGGGMSLKNDITHENFGGGFDFGYTGKLASSDVSFRASLGVNVMPGKEAREANLPYRYDAFAGDLAGADQNCKGSLVGYQLAGDIYTNIGVSGLRLITGISLNKWRMKRSASFAVDTPYVSGYDSNDDPVVGTIPAGTVHYDESGTVKGIKFGGRIGLDYQINNHWSANLLCQVTELGKDYYSTKGLNPSWIQLGARYTF